LLHLAAFASKEVPAMERIERFIEVERPLSSVYNQWTQFEEFPRFMKGVKDVRQLDDTHVHWRAEMWGKVEEWDAEITEQDPDTRISWKSISGPFNAGTVRFEALGTDRTCVRLAMSYEAKDALERLGDALGIFAARVRDTLQDFKTFMEARTAETGGWRGQVVDGKTQPPESRAVDEASKESFPASDPPASWLPDEPPRNANAKWAAVEEAARKARDRKRD